MEPVIDRAASGATQETASKPAPRRLPFGIPIPVAVLGLPCVAIIGVAIATHLFAPAAQSPHSSRLRTTDLVLQDRPDGSIAVFQANDHHLVDVIPPTSNAFLRVLLAGLVRERRREGEGAPSLPFRVTRWSDGRLTIDDIATHKLIELNAFGPDNAGAFARLLDLSQPPSTAPAKPSVSKGP